MIRSVADLTGQVFQYLTVMERMPKNYHNSTAVYWRCVCKCGKEVFPTTHDLLYGKTTSCGCRKNEMAHNRVKVNPGDRYNKLLVIQRVENKPGDHHSRWDCLCDCGNHVVVFGKDLISGKRGMCVACANKVQHDNRAIDITGERFGKLVAVRCVGSRNNSRVWECRCDCGNTAYVPVLYLRSGNTKSCGCMREHSFNEDKINDMLRAYGVDFKREFSFDDCLSESGTKLRFDFAVFKDGKMAGLIEYQGEQHFIPANNGFGAYQREVSDDLKKDYCLKKDIPLYEIKYDDDIKCMVDHVLVSMGVIASDANTVPSLDNEEGVTTISQEST